LWESHPPRRPPGHNPLGRPLGGGPLLGLLQVDPTLVGSHDVLEKRWHPFRFFVRRKFFPPKLPSPVFSLTAP